MIARLYASTVIEPDRVAGQLVEVFLGGVGVAPKVTRPDDRGENAMQLRDLPERIDRKPHPRFVRAASGAEGGA
jgi:hypothetical protein